MGGRILVAVIGGIFVGIACFFLFAQYVVSMFPAVDSGGILLWLGILEE
jgi:hypothetical protein